MTENLDLGPSQSPGAGRSQLARISNTGDAEIAPAAGAFASARNQIFNHVRYMQKIIVYADVGVDGSSLKHLIRSLQQEIDPEKCTLRRMDAKALLQEPWEQEARLLVIPGGRDVFYHASLDGVGTAKIRRFVENGGNYLGLCAGAYFACNSIEFEKGGPIEVCAERSLKFFPGIARGPAFGPNKYSYENARGVEAAKVSWEKEECHAYFNGGCAFVSEDHYPWIKTLSHYLDLPHTPAAILEIEAGKGRAILSGVHIEYSPHLLNDEDPYLAKIIPPLQKTDGKRKEIFRACLQKLAPSTLKI